MFLFWKIMFRTIFGIRETCRFQNWYFFICKMGTLKKMFLNADDAKNVLQHTPSTCSHAVRQSYSAVSTCAGTSCQRIKIDDLWFKLLDIIDPIDTLWDIDSRHLTSSKATLRSIQCSELYYISISCAAAKKDCIVGWTQLELVLEWRQDLCLEWSGFLSMEKRGFMFGSGDMICVKWYKDFCFY